MTRFIIILMSVFLVAACGNDKSAETTKMSHGTLSEDEDVRTLYTMGYMLAQPAKSFGFTEDELAHLQHGFSESVLGKDAQVELQDYMPKVQALAKEKMDKAVEVEKAASVSFLAEQAKVEGAEVMESGLVYTEITAGEGASPAATDRVKVHYHGTLSDGTVFDSSVERGEPITFGLNQVIACWTEGVQKMKVGGKSRLVCPSDIAYGDRGSPPKIKPGAALVFEVELFDIETPEAVE